MLRAAPQPRSFGRLLGMRTVLAANVALFCLVAWGVGGEFLRNRELQKEIDGLEAQAKALESNNTEAVKLGEHFAQSGLVEREARTKLGLQKPGESVIIVRDVTPLPEGKSEAIAAAAAPPPLSNAQKWWLYFFH